MNTGKVSVMGALLMLAASNLYADCTLYDAPGMRGESRILGAGEKLGNLGWNWDNRTSSVGVTDQCKLTLYSDPNFRGDNKVFSADASSVGSLWDNQASSAVCTCPPPPPPPPGNWGAGNWGGRDWNGRHHHNRNNWRNDWNRPPPPPPQACRLYRDMNFAGGELALAASNSYSTLAYGMNDQTSSIKVPQGCKLTVYSREGLSGRSRVFLEGDYNFIGQEWDDRISSADCSCR
jgi:hypothetical protein